MIADLSANHVERQALLCGFTAQRVLHDYGIDLYVQTYNRRGENENGQIPIQLKATRHIRFVAEGQAVACRIELADLAYWLNEPMPVILVLYDARVDVAYWMYVRDYYEAHPKWKGATSRTRLTIRIPTSNVVNRRAMRRFARDKNARTARQQGVSYHEI